MDAVLSAYLGAKQRGEAEGSKQGQEGQRLSFRGGS